jgi:MtrB/PioB family decaheme-associated outer membrane protein
MRGLVLAPLVCWLGVVVPAAALAQATTQPPSTVLPDDSQAKPAPAAQAPEPEAEVPRSLFEPTGRQFQIGGRLSSISGDPARWQRYQDLRDGVLFTDARYEREEVNGAWLFHAAADNVGFHDQRYFADYERTGRFVISGLWDEIPQFYSVDTQTPYTTTKSPLLLDDATQRSIQTGQATLSAWIPVATQFDLTERRDIGRVNLVATPTPQLDVKASFTTQRHVGGLPWGGSFGFGNDVEVSLPYDSRTNDLSIGTEWTNGRNMLRVAYDGSWFDNPDDTLVWDSPLRVDDSTSAPGRGRMSLWPTNSAQTVSAAGYHKMARHTQLTGFVSYGLWSNNSALQPFTINSALPQIALPRNTAEAEAHVFTTNLNLVSRPSDDWRVSARVRRYDYNNETPATSITQYVAYDTSVSTTPTGGPDLFAHSRTNFDADATWNHVKPLALTVGYSRNDAGYDARIFNGTGENVLRLSADAVGTSWLTFRAQYELGDRTGSGLDQALLTEIGEQPLMRHYDLADRTRNRFTAQADVVPSDAWTLSASIGVLKDDFSNTFYGLENSSGRSVSVAADYHQPNGFGGGATYNYERYAGLQRSHEGDSSAAQFNDPLRDWTADSTETVHYLSLYVTPPRIGPNTEVRASYDISHAEGDYFYTIPAGSPITTPNQLPNVFNKLQQLHVDVRHRLSNRLAATFSYLYEPFRVYDFAFDRTVVNSIVQPSSLVLGYVYRPYTANSFVFGLRYFW